MLFQHHQSVLSLLLCLASPSPAPSLQAWLPLQMSRLGVAPTAPSSPPNCPQCSSSWRRPEQGERQGGRKGGRQGRREGGREAGREGGRQGGRKGGRGWGAEGRAGRRAPGPAPRPESSLPLSPPLLVCLVLPGWECPIGCSGLSGGTWSQAGRAAGSRLSSRE